MKHEGWPKRLVDGILRWHPRQKYSNRRLAADSDPGTRAYLPNPALFLMPTIGADATRQLLAVEEMVRSAARSWAECSTDSTARTGAGAIPPKLEYALSLYGQALALLARSPGFEAVFQENGILRPDLLSSAGEVGSSVSQLVRLAYEARRDQADILWQLGRDGEAARAYTCGASIEAHGEWFGIQSVCTRANAFALELARSDRGALGQEGQDDLWAQLENTRSCAEQLVGASPELDLQELWGVALLYALSPSAPNEQQLVANRIYQYGCLAPAPEVMRRLSTLRNLESGLRSAAHPVAARLKWAAEQLELCADRTEKSLPILRACPLFAALTDDQLSSVIRASHIESYGDGAAVFEEGDRGDAAYVVMAGNVDIRVGGEAGQNTVATVGPGELLGEIAAFTEMPRTASIVVKQTAALMKIEQSTIRKLVGESPEIANTIIGELGSRLRRQNAAIGLISKAVRAVSNADIRPDVVTALRQDAGLGELNHIYGWLSQTLATGGSLANASAGTRERREDPLRRGADMPGVASAVRIVDSANDSDAMCLLDIFPTIDGFVNIHVIANPDARLLEGGTYDLLRCAVRALTPELRDPAAVLQRLNRLLMQHMRDQCEVTAFLARLNAPERKLTFASAGYRSCACLDNESQLSWLPANASPVGRFAETTFVSKQLDVSTGHVIIFAESPTENRAEVNLGIAPVDDNNREFGTEQLSHRIQTALSSATGDLHAAWSAIEFK